jgi:hypothetical protein
MSSRNFSKIPGSICIVKGGVMRQYLFILLCLIGGFSQAEFAFAQSTEYELTEDEYAVYVVLLGEKRKLAVIETTEAREISDKDSDNGLRKWFSENQFGQALSEATIKDFFSKKAHPRPLMKNLFKTDINCIIVDRAEREAIFQQASGLRKKWESFYKKYPDSGGFYRFSRVGFNQERTQALVFVQNFCGSLCASGNWVRLAKKDGKWVSEERYLSWVS